MTYPESIAEIEAEISRDRVELEQAIRQKEQLSGNIPRFGFRAVSIGIDLRFNIHRLSDRLSRNKRLLVSAKQRSELNRD